MSRLTRVIPALVCIVAFALSVSTAGATVIGHEHYSGTESSSFDDCGFTLDVQSEFRGNALLRVEKGGQAFLASDNYWFRDVLTNADTGGWFAVRGNGLFHEIKATKVRGTIYEFVAVESGQPFVIENSAGKVVLRDRGSISFTYLFDTLEGHVALALVRFGVADITSRGWILQLAAVGVHRRLFELLLNERRA